MSGGRGAAFAAEWTHTRDPETGAAIIQLTSAPSINHPSYFLQCSFLPGDRALFFTSYRTGQAQLFEASLDDGTLRQLTEGVAIHPFSPALHPAGREIVFTRGSAILALDLATLSERLLLELPEAQLGECSLSPDGDWLVAAFKGPNGQGLVVGRMDGCGSHVIPFPRTVIHPQFHPLEAEWIEFAGDPAPRMHRVRRDGTGLECLYEHGNDEFVVHETFLGSTGDIVFTVWPYRLCRMDWTTRQIRTIAEHNAWHIAPNRAGTAILCDTNHPDRGIQTIDVATGAIRTVCLPESSNQGTQWKRDCYALAEDFAAARSAAATLSWMENATDSVYGPQWTHPHPSWSHSERQIAFTSDRTGHPQVYVAGLPFSVPGEPARCAS